ncbi:hypothetical protein AX14_003583 [Amanita brunnescens Koide BX004]|nr:hypothetical protein AX14_003583 [Amanita brunnescens Koide BX004]
MLLRKIGDSIIPAVGFGTGGVGVAGYGSLRPFEDRLKLFDFLYENGCTHWDTADVYGEGEALIGEWLRRTGKRREVFIATKFGFTPRGLRGDPGYVKEAAKRSLRNLGVEYIDLYYLHRPDTNTPIELTIKAMAELVSEGKVKYLGLSNPSAETLRRAHKIHPIAAIEVEFSPLVLEVSQPPNDLIQVAKELDIAVVIYSPLARGLVTGRFTSPAQFELTDYRHGIPRYSKKNFPEILKVVAQIEKIAEQRNATPAQVTLAWTLAQGDRFFVIPGTQSPKRIKENLESVDVSLSKKDIRRLWGISRAADKSIKGYPDIPPIAIQSFTDTPPLTTD